MIKIPLEIVEVPHEKSAINVFIHPNFQEYRIGFTNEGEFVDLVRAEFFGEGILIKYLIDALMKGQKLNEDNVKFAVEQKVKT